MSAGEGDGLTSETGGTAGPRPTAPRKKVVTLRNLSADGCRQAVLNECRSSLTSGTPIEFDLSDSHGFYPNGVVPLVGIIEHYRAAGVRVSLTGLPRIAERMSIRNPIEATKQNLGEEPDVLSRAWAYFGHEQANGFVTAAMDSIRRRAECNSGVLEALEWCLYEVMDNVNQHAQAEIGFVMVQVHPAQNRLAICVSDTGVGIHRSLASSRVHKPPTALDALTLAIREGVTRNEKTNQGNGLWGLSEIVRENRGTLVLRSGRGQLSMTKGTVTGGNNCSIIGPNNHGTTVDFQIALDHAVSLGDTLNYAPVNHFLEELESADGEHVLLIRDQAGGAGSREAARELKTLIVNVLSDVAHVVLDFEGQSVVSSSFADEVIGKMFVEMGYSLFAQRVHLRNMNPTVTALVDLAIEKRMRQSNP